MNEQKIYFVSYFDLYTNAWEQRRLGDIVDIQRGGSPRPIDAYITADSDGLNWIKIGDAPEIGRYITRTAEKIKKEGLSKTREVYPGDLILSNSMTFGKPYIMKIYGCIHDGWLVIHDTKQAFDLFFLCVLLGTPGMIREYRRLAAGSTVNNLNKDLVGGANIFFPKKGEQEKVGKIIDHIDTLITLHQRKLDKLKNVKKAMIEKMFPTHGTTVPQLRFKGFVDAWEQRRLKDIGTILTGNTPSTSNNDYYADNGLQWITPTDIGEMGEVHPLRYLSSSGVLVARVVPANTILVTCIASIGKNAIVDTVSSFNQQINSLTPDITKVNPYFLFVDSYHWASQMKKQAASGTMQIVNKSEFSYMETHIPSLFEQETIAVFFREVNTLITLHQRKLEYTNLICHHLPLYV